MRVDTKVSYHGGHHQVVIDKQPLKRPKQHSPRRPKCRIKSVHIYHAGVVYRGIESSYIRARTTAKVKAYHVHISANRADMAMVVCLHEPTSHKLIRKRKETKTKSLQDCIKEMGVNHPL